MLSSPVFNDRDDSIWHGKRGDGASFFEYSGVDVEYFVCSLAVSSWAEEYSAECSEAHCVCDGWVVMVFDVGSEGCCAMFVEIEFTTKDIFPGRVFVRNRSCYWDAVLLAKYTRCIVT